MKSSRYLRAIAACGWSTLLIADAASADTYGKQERVRMMSTPPIEVVGLLDSGVEQSSLQAVDVKYFINDGDTWARFTIDNGSVLPGSHVQVERAVIRDNKTRQNGGGIEHHPVVEMDLCIGNRLLKAEINLSDRNSYTPPLVIGRNELAKLGSVDSSRKFTHNATCVADAGSRPSPSP